MSGEGYKPGNDGPPQSPPQNEGPKYEIGPILADLRARMKTGESPYQDIIEEQHNKAFLAAETGTAYSETFWEWMHGERDNDVPAIQQDRAFIQERVRGTIVIDLGCGENAHSAISMVEHSEFGAAAAIEVDFFSFREWLAQGETDPLAFHSYDEHLGSPNNNMPECTLVQADMLDFVSRLPDNSVNFIINGIDGYILGLNNPYVEALAKEIARTLRKGGIIIGNAMEAVSHQFTGGLPPHIFSTKTKEEFSQMGITPHPTESSVVLSPELEIFEKN